MLPRTLEQGPQAPVFLGQRFQPLKIGFLTEQLSVQAIVFVAQRAARLELAEKVAQSPHGPVDDVVDRFNRVLGHGACARYEMTALVHGHEHHREQSVKHESCGLGRGPKETVSRAGVSGNQTLA